MLIVTTNGIPGYRIEAVLGQVMGMTVRTANLGSNIAAGFRSLGGGELPELTKIVYESRNEVLNRMWSECLRRGGNAVVGMSFDTGELGKNFTEVCAFGTAVVATPIPDGEPGATPQSIARAAAENPGPGNWPRFDQGGGAPAPSPEFGEGHRSGAGQPHGESGLGEPARREPQPPPAVDRAAVPGLDDAPTNEVPGRREHFAPAADPAPMPDQAARPRTPDQAAQPRTPDQAARPRTPEQHQSRPARPEEQRPNSGDSWLDLG